MRIHDESETYGRPDVVGVALILIGVSFIWCAIGFVAGKFVF